MDRTSRLKDIFFNNLLLLGFDKAAIEKEYRVICDKNMFSVPNQRMFEAVTQFLFSKLKGKYILSWPLLDKDQHRQFQKSTYNYLCNIAQESNVKFPRITPSLISTFGGERFYELYVAFSSHVVEQQIKANGNVELLLCPKVSTLNCKNIVETLKIETISSSERSQYIQKLSYEYFEELLKYANEFSLLHKTLRSTLIANKSKQQEQLIRLHCVNSEKYTPEVTSAAKCSLRKCMAKSISLEEQVKTNWVTLEKFLHKEKELWNYIRPEVEGTSEKYALDSTHIKVTVPDIIKKEHREELNALGISSVLSEENEKPNLLKYLKFFIIILESYKKVYETGNVSNLHNHCEIENTQNLDESLCKMHNLCEKMANVLTNIKESTENLHESLLAPEFSEDLEDFIKECPSWNFNSKSFHEGMEFSRSKISLPFSNEGEDQNPKFSLLSNAETKHNSDESSSSQEVLGAGIDLSIQHNLPASINLKPTEHLNDYTLHDRSLNYLENSVFQEPLFEIKCKTNSKAIDEFLPESLLPDHIQKNNLRDVNNCTASPLPDILVDFDIDYSKPLKMRESWLLEDSLQATTFPDDNLSD